MIVRQREFLCRVVFRVLQRLCALLQENKAKVHILGLEFKGDWYTECSASLTEEESEEQSPVLNTFSKLKRMTCE